MYEIFRFLEFDAEVQRERVKAQDALKDIESIKELISNVSLQAREAERVLNGSEDNAKNAREIAQNAQVKLLRNTTFFKVTKASYTNNFISIYINYFLI